MYKGLLIQIHVKGASDGCLLAVGQKDFIKGTTCEETPYLNSSSAQTAFMSTIMKFNKEDIANGFSEGILLSFERLHDNPDYKLDIQG